MVVSGATIDSLLREKERYTASDAFRKNALVKDEKLHERAAKDPEGYWAEEAGGLHVDKGGGEGPPVGRPVRAMVRRREDQRVPELPGPPRPHAAPEQGGDRLGG